jgi:hypothetical protein
MVRRTATAEISHAQEKQQRFFAEKVELQLQRIEGQFFSKIT